MSKTKQKPDPLVESDEKSKLRAEHHAELLANQGSIADSKWLTLVLVARYLNCSAMTIHRYANDPNYAHLNFPKPSVVVDRCYWDRTEIDAWMRSRVGAISSRKIKTKEAVA